LEYHFNKPQLLSNCILLNLKKDIDRFHSVKEELSKLSINAEESLIETTYWKDKEQLQNDLNFILSFLRKYNKNIKLEQVNINDFYEQNDPLITIQAGPLACYCSHVKAMIHGFQNFEQYTIICEDDISISNLSNIQANINLIPSDWDVICFNSQPMNMINDNSEGPYYKFNGCFYHLHFYVIKNKCFETIFQNLYPITDQIDIIFSRLHNKLNIYNIPNTVYQKNFITNIQNNLHVIYNTSVYKKMVNDINELEKLILNMVENHLPENSEFNKHITEKIMEDVIYNNVFNNIKIDTFEFEKYDNTMLQDNSFPIYNQINKILQQHYKIKDNINKFILHLISEIEFIILSFHLHNHNENGIKMKAYNFGSSSSVYKLNDDIIKVYNKRLRWVCDEHNKINDIFAKELQIMSILDLIKSYDNENMILRMNYKGETLYNKFILPSNYKEQINCIFDDLNSKNIYYPEFNINNIVVKDDEISFIDFGLARIVEGEDINKENKTNFIELLEILNNRFKEIDDDKKRRILYNTFINNMKSQKKYISNIF
jgi:hypothetical protein